MKCILIDAYSSCSADVSDLRDFMTIKARVKDEGISFLSITLPDFCRDFERSLAIGRIDSTFFRCFRKNGSIPVFLQGMTSQIFDIETGRMYETYFTAPSSIAPLVDAIRQICLAFKKVSIDCTPERVSSAMAKYVSLEATFDESLISEEARGRFSHVAFVLWSDMLRTLHPSMFTPQHGPGATAERISGNGKYNWQFWHERLEPYFPIVGNGYSISADSERMLENVTFLSEESELPVRVVAVPKTQKSPRIIAIEPCCMQFAQQGIQRILVDAIESSWSASGSVNFSDQSINHNLAITGSRDGRLVTIDLSDASDRVPLSLAMTMFESNMDIHDSILACRSTSARLPDGSIVSPLKKFASMGSALCFPVESMYFYTICVGTILKEMDLPVTRRSILRIKHLVRIYGDDIIVPKMHADAVLADLQKYSCKVNHNKTFVTGKFRESCGADAYGGVEVTPVYLRSLQPKNRQQASELLSWCSSAHQFYLKGYWTTAQYLYKSIERVVGSLPYVSFESQALGRKSFLGFLSVGRWNEKYQRLEVKAWVPTPVYRTDELDGYGALMKTFQRPRDVSILPLVTDRDHLLRSALHGEVALKRRWVPAT
jgi:hypothetical protein